MDLKAFFDGIPVEIAPHTDLVITSLGNGIGQTTSVERQSGASEGPNSFLVHRDGTVYVLDQLNRRVQIFKDGNAIGVVPIPSPTIEEVYPDAKYHDTCISEIQFFLESGLIPLVVQKR